MAGPQSPVAGGAVYIAAADFNNDGIDDVAVSGTRKVVTVLFGSPDGSFNSPVSMPVGTSLNGIITGDFSQHKASNEAAIDIAVAGGSKVYILPEQVQGGRGTGTFGQPASFPLKERAVDIAAGYLDCPIGCADANLKRLDIATANGAFKTLTLLFDPNPTTRSYQRPPPIATGPNAHALVVQDFNGDGADDIAVLLTGYTGADVVSVYLNNGTGTFSSPLSYPVSIAATALTVGNFHGDIDTDSVQDIAVLNKGSATMESSISLLLNRTIRLPDGKLQGTGFFDSLPAFRVSCPAKFGGIPIKCTPQGIISGDFDGDGFNDFAVSFSATAVSTSTAIAGFVNVYTGREDGGFDFATQVLVGVGPRQIVAGDFTGHGNSVKDIVVTESGSSTVRILRNVPPPPKPGGWSCRLDDQCQAGLHCVDHICCALPDNALSCPSGEFCNISGSLGVCSPPGPSGIPCGSAEQCQTGFCVDGFCCTAASCLAGEYCNTGACAAPALSGSPCSKDEQCTSGHCVNNVCCDSDSCPNTQSCNVPGFEGQCTPLVSLGNACTSSDQCVSGFCADGVCCYSAWCPTGQACNISGSLGQCTYLPTPTPTSTRTPTITWTPTPTLTPTPVPIGGPCSAGITLCESPNQCVDGICCNAACPSGQHCNITNFVGTCHVQLPDTSPCSKNTDCLSNYCAPSGRCAPAPTSTPTPTPTPLGPGDDCSDGSPCRTGYVCNHDEQVCCKCLDLLPGQSCLVPGKIGQCAMVPTATATPPATATPTATATVTPTPCDETSCEAQGTGWRCDITGYVGTCSAPFGYGEGPCGKHTDCEAALICNPNTGLCDWATTPTEPPLPTQTPVCPPGQFPSGNTCVEVHTSRSGGCSIGDPSARGTAAPATSAAGTDTWLVALLPLALGIRRLRRQETRAHAQRPIRIASQ